MHPADAVPLINTLRERAAYHQIFLLQELATRKATMDISLN